MTLLAKLVKTKQKSLKVNISNTITQSGSNDCGVYAAAYATSLAFGHDPCSFVYDQSRLRKHFLQCLEQEKVTPFPYVRLRRTDTPHIQSIDVYCYCRCPDNGEKMIFCDGKGCGEWFHFDCTNTNTTVKKKTNWYCNNCNPTFVK